MFSAMLGTREGAMSKTSYLPHSVCVPVEKILNKQIITHSGKSYKENK